MAVYIDDMKMPFGRMKMSHMIADTEEELHEMAMKLGLKRDWFQDKSIPHYDISQSKKKQAIELGAIEVTSNELIYYARRGEHNERE